MVRTSCNCFENLVIDVVFLVISLQGLEVDDDDEFEDDDAKE